MRERRNGCRAVLCCLLLTAVQSARAEGTPAAECTQYVDAEVVISTNPLTKQFSLNAVDHKTATETQTVVCFGVSGAAFLLNGKQLTIRNDTGAPFVIDNLYVQQTKLPAQCLAQSGTCFSVSVTGTSPVILRNPRIEWVGPAATPEKPTTTDGLMIQSDHVTIEVTPEKVTDPAYVTVKNFRTGIVVDQRTGVVLDGVKIQRTAAQVGSLGLRVAGPENTVTNAQIDCADTGIHALGGTAAAPIQITGGTISAGACATDAGVFLQGDHVFLTDTAIVGPKIGVILDPLNGPMGITGGSITKAQIGVEVRNATPATLLALQLDTFTEVDQLYDFTMVAAPTAPTVTWTKTCAQTVAGVAQKVCDTTDADNVVTSINGTLTAEQCAGEIPGTMLLYEKSGTSAVGMSVCGVGLSSNDMCEFSCTHTIFNKAFAVSFDTKLQPVFLNHYGAAMLEVIAVEKIGDKPTDLGPLAPLPLPIVLGAAMGGEETGNTALDGVLPGGEDGAETDTLQVASGMGGNFDATPPANVPLAGDDSPLPPTDDRATTTTTTTTAAAAGGDAVGGGATGGVPLGAGVAGCSLIQH